MSRLIILGGGGHGRVVADTARRTGRWEHVLFLDDAPDRTRAESDFAVLGTCKDLDQVLRPGDECVVAIGDNAQRRAMLDQVNLLSASLATIIDPSASVSADAQLGPGTVVLPQCAVNIGAVLGRGCIVNTGATVDHDCRLGECIHVAPGAHLGGDVSVGDLSWIGIGASVRHGIRVGARVMVGAGAAVVANVATGSTVVGVPAEPLVSREHGH
jgi:sugar O-acyltransferase (sialic acid O-acetyltransferase NeuD family)